MSDLCIQIQPNRAPNLDLSAVRHHCDLLAAKEPLVHRVDFVEGDDDGPYLNLMFETNKLQALWNLLQQQFYQDSTMGAHLARASIVTCEGDQGWDDYLLLHHYDRTLRLDKFTGN